MKEPEIDPTNPDNEPDDILDRLAVGTVTLEEIRNMPGRSIFDLITEHEGASCRGGEKTKV